MLVIGRFTVFGHSMEPNFKIGQSVVVSGIPYLFSAPQPGDAIVFQDHKKAILKRITKASNDKYLVMGDNHNDSKDFGWVIRSQIIGKVIFSL